MKRRIGDLYYPDTHHENIEDSIIENKDTSPPVSHLVLVIAIFLILILAFGTYKISQRSYEDNVKIFKDNYYTMKVALGGDLYKAPDSNPVYKYFMSNGGDWPIVNIWVRYQERKIKERIESYAANYENLSEDKQNAIKAFDFLNQERERLGRQALEWDERAYELALDRSLDMVARNYFDHVTPEGTCAKDFQEAYGFGKNEKLWENARATLAGGWGGDVVGTRTPGVEMTAVEAWFKSRGHRYNNLYPTHTKGALACYGTVCVFFGITVHEEGKDVIENEKCHGGLEGLSFWAQAPKMPNEI